MNMDAWVITILCVVFAVTTAFLILFGAHLATRVEKLEHKRPRLCPKKRAMIKATFHNGSPYRDHHDPGCYPSGWRGDYPYPECNDCAGNPHIVIRSPPTLEELRGGRVATHARSAYGELSGKLNELVADKDPDPTIDHEEARSTR